MEPTKALGEMSNSELTSIYNKMVAEAVKEGLQSYRPMSEGTKFKDKAVGLKRIAALESSLKAFTEGQQKAETTIKKEPIPVKETAPVEEVTTPEPKTINTNTKQRDTKTAQVKVLLLRENGCTTADVLEATGWPSVSMPAMAKNLGLTLRKEKEEGKVTRYYGD
jgi:U3 small nucleolar RNA-associated protein 14